MGNRGRAKEEGQSLHCIRWRKVWRDLWIQKPRTLLVVLSIALGVIGVGMIGQSKSVFIQGMENSYEESNPSHITILSESFGRDIVQIVSNQPDIKAVEAKKTIYGRINAASGGENRPVDTEWKEFQLFAAKDFPGMNMDKVYPRQGQWPPADGELFLDETSMQYLNLMVGDSVWMDLGNGLVPKLRITGVVTDPLRDSAYITGRCYGYVTLETLNQFDLSPTFNTLALKVETNESDVKHLNDVAIKVRDLLNDNDINVFTITIPPPGKHWAYDLVVSISYILQVFGLLIMVLGSTLIINTIFAIIIGQLRQIGVMKVTGASTGTLIGMYMGSIAILGLLALVVGVPLGLGAAEWITRRSLQLLHFQSIKDGSSALVIVQQIGVGLVLPLLVSCIPVVMGTRIPERVAIGGLLDQTRFGQSRFENALKMFRFVSRPLALSLRNTFRRKGRLLLTLFTLSLGGAVVISVFSVQESIQQTIENVLKYSNYDFRIGFSSPQPKQESERLASEVPGVARVESWYQHMATRLRTDGSKSQDWSIVAPPADSTFILPKIVQGRWFRSGDENEIVLNTYLLRQETDIRIGDELELRFKGSQYRFRVVGFAAAPAEVDGYADYSTLTRLNDADQMASMIQVKTNEQDRDQQATIAAATAKYLEERGIKVNSPMLSADIRKVQETKYSIITVLLTIMSLVLVLVAALSLTGTMGLNMLERTREIGIMSSIGATDYAIWRIVIFEGAFIGLMSWAGAVLFAIPISQMICYEVGMSLFQAPLDYIYSYKGVFVWLSVVLLVSASASFAPAWRASKLPVKDVLNYE
ncbi:ABC transporter permease [Paenibacillus rigui]|uniref:ABC transporter permease n=1 Tax=Paenibacillus rigui TaxID=554312 RepID=A0A229UGP0_9BACL|nr:FtsX-like permease family protein [Paenibacillus rigui]OXM82564.1 hypothetical protein CF651_30230 [Paenibacillus rigui]